MADTRWLAAPAPKVPASGTHVDLGTRADPGARLSARRHDAHDASAECSSAPTDVTAAVAAASSTTPSPVRPPTTPSSADRSVDTAEARPVMAFAHPEPVVGSGGVMAS